jgi:hypothetical protein
MGSDIMSVAANTGDQYTGMSGTSMATPGAAGVGALMLQANPDLSPFDIRNIMQETATYRQCHYMGANEPCPEDLIPKNRQNNVYGHGHVNALESVIEAAEYQQQWNFDRNITLNVSNSLNSNGHVYLGPGDSIEIRLNQGVDTVQWMSNDLRDSWSNIHSYDHGSTVILEYDEIVHELEHLPGIMLEGNHTLSMRGLEGTSSSPLISIDIMLGENIPVEDPAEGSTNFVLYGSVIAAILLTIIILAATLTNRNESEFNTSDDSDIQEVVDAEIIS